MHETILIASELRASAAPLVAHLPFGLRVLFYTLLVALLATIALMVLLLLRLQKTQTATQSTNSGGNCFGSIEQAQEIAGLGSWSWEPATDHVHWSPACYQRFGLSPDSFQPSPATFVSLVHPDDRMVVQECLQSVASGQLDKFAQDIRIIKSDGSIVWIHSVARARRDASGNLIRLEGIDQDITLRKQIEHDVRQAQKMEAVARLAGGIAHDFNNLLTVIKGYSELLLSESHRRQGSGIAWRESLEEIRDAGDRAARLTSQLLTFSGRAILQPRHVDLNSIIRSAYESIRSLVAISISIEMELDEQLPPVVTDDQQLEHVLLNLVLNACDAMPKGGQLSIKTSQKTFAQEQEFLGRLIRPGKYAVLSVADTGKGIAAADQCKIFEPFFSTKLDQKSSGLGLSVVHGVASENGGYVVLESQLNEGSTFHVMLPVGSITLAPTPKSHFYRPATPQSAV